MSKNVKILDIKEKEIVVKSNATTVQFVVQPNIDKLLEDKGLVSKCIHPTFEKKIYRIIPIVDNLTNKKDYIGVEDEELFNKLLCISKERLDLIKDHHFNKGTQGGYTAGFQAGRKNGYDKCFNELRQHIKELPWWKRLFNKF